MLNALPQPRAPSFAPTLIILNASIHTFDPSRPIAEAIAVGHNRVAALGSTSAVQRLAGPDTVVLDARERLVLPGFNDAHVHFLAGGFSLSMPDLRQAACPGAFASKIGEYARTLPSGRWILGGDWDHERWPCAPLPDRELIDPVTRQHPVFVSRIDGHMALVNSLALKLAGVSKSTPNPPGGLIVRDVASGEPTGILKDSALDLIERVVPPRTFDEKLAAARAASDHAARLGVTSVTDMSAGRDVAVYQSMVERGQLKTRIYAASSIVDWQTLASVGVRAAFGGNLLRIGAVKGFADGSLGASTALFFEPYDDEPRTRGLLFSQMLPEGAMLEKVQAADQAGLQVMIHAIGDEANLRVLDLYEEVAHKNRVRDRRFRIEHAQHLRDSEIPRFGLQKVIASVQPAHLADDGCWCEKRLGPGRAKGSYAFRSLLEQGAVLAFGSDWTVAPLKPLAGIKAAVTRQTRDGRHPQGWLPEQKLSLADALRAFTFGSAYAEFAERTKGTLAPGMLADLVMLDRDLFRMDPAEIDQARIVLTIVDGRVVFENL